MKTLTGLFTSVLLSGWAAMAVAQSPSMAPQGPGSGGRNMPAFAEFDLNRDGVLEKEEFIEARGQRVAKRAGEGRMMRGLANMPDFETIDGNGDGRISPEEFYRHQSAHRTARPANRP